MGCINSTKNKLNASSENVFRVRVVRMQPELRQGWLELTPAELVFLPQSPPRDEPQHVVWALQHLRRYGLSGDNVFSFEAGRRCMSGPGIWTFRCQHGGGGELYQLFQRYVNAVSLVTDATERERDRDHPSHTLGRPPGGDALHQPHTNNYLEPAPLAMSAMLRPAAPLHETFVNSSSSPLDSPDSVPSLSFTNDEVVHFQSGGGGGSGSYANTPNASGNVYLDHPLRGAGSVIGGGCGMQAVGGGVGHIEYNNNNNNHHTHFHTGGMSAGGSGAGSAFNTLSRKTIVKLSSLDVPPEECAPMLLTPGSATSAFDALHMYANVEGLGTRSAAAEKAAASLIDPAERCYENLSRLDLPLLLQPPPPPSSRDGSAAQTPSSAAATAAATAAAVNYIVLDLDQPRSPAQCSPKTYFGSGNSLDERASMEPLTASGNELQMLLLPPATVAVTLTATTTNALTTGTTPKTNEETSSEQQAKAESSLGYSTIDFIKTCALIKSSTHADFDPADHDHDQESRITRHSKCVRKAYSISE